jgi:hypothetical protein
MTDAIRALREAVEAGKARGRYGQLCDDTGLDAVEVMRADVSGSLDAALALMQAVLPEWDWNVDNWSGASGAAVHPPHDGEWVFGSADTPARALLLAILKALEASQSSTKGGEQ